MQQTYGRTPMPKFGFNKVANWNHTSAWVFFCKFAAYFQNTFFYEDTWVAASERYLCNEVRSLQLFPTIWKLNKNKELTMSTQKITAWGPWGSFTYLANIPVRYVTALITNTFLIKKWKCTRKLRGVSMFKPKYLLEMNWSIKVCTEQKNEVFH